MSAELVQYTEANTERRFPRAIMHVEARGETHELLSLPSQKRRNGTTICDEVLANIDAMLEIDARLADGMPLMEARRDVALSWDGCRGMSFSALSRKHHVWLKGGRKVNTKGKPYGPMFGPRDWHYFVPAYNHGSKDSTIRNTQFSEYVAGLIGDRQRTDIGQAVRRQLLRDWQQGKHIPGFGTIQKWCATQVPPRPVPASHLPLRPADYPQGWSPTNIARCVDDILGSRKSALMVYMQRGEHAAMSHWADQLYRSRANLRPLELVTCDDVDLDIYCWMPDGQGHAQVVRPKCLFMLDVASGMILNWGMVGQYTRYYDSDGGSANTKRSIQTTDMKELFLATLEMYGIPQEWQMHELHENATAKLSETDMEMIGRYLPIQFASTQMMQRKLPGGFMESCGNPKQKGWIESLFRLLHIELNHLPGTIGRRYELTRGDVGTALWRGGKQVASRKDTLVGETLRIITEAGKLARERGCDISELLDDGSGDSSRFRLPVLKIDQLATLIDQYVELLNLRIDHDLEGFDQVIDVEIRPGVYMPDYHPQAAMVARPGMRSRQRMESPRERFERLSYGHTFRKPHPREMMVLARECKPVTVTNGRVSVENARYGTGKLHYLDAESAEALASWNGKKKGLVYIMSPSGHQIHLFTNDEAMQYVASPLVVDRPDIMDEHAMQVRMGEVSRNRDALRTQAADLMAHRTAEVDQRREHNTRVADAISAAESASGEVAERRATPYQFPSSDLLSDQDDDEDDDGDAYPAFGSLLDTTNNQ